MYHSVQHIIWNQKASAHVTLWEVLEFSAERPLGEKYRSNNHMYGNTASRDTFYNKIVLTITHKAFIFPFFHSFLCMSPSLSGLFFKISRTRKSLSRQRSRTLSVDTTSTSKSVHFQDYVETYDVYSPAEYDRRPSNDVDDFHIPSLALCMEIEKDEAEDERDPAYARLVEKNTRMNQKLGHNSLAVLISYRSVR